MCTVKESFEKTHKVGFSLQFQAAIQEFLASCNTDTDFTDAVTGAVQSSGRVTIPESEAIAALNAARLRAYQHTCGDRPHGPPLVQTRGGGR